MRILILGGSGMLGHKLWQRLARQFPDTWVTLRGVRDVYVTGTLFAGPHVLENVDITDFGDLERLLSDVRPNVVVNCTGVTPRRDLAEDRGTCIAVNALLPHTLAAWGQRAGARLIHFSTDCVFDGATGGYTEESLTSAVDLYGRTKALGEVLNADNALTLRSSIIGREIIRRTELLEWFLAQKGRRIKGYRQALYTGVSTNYMADLVAELLVRFPFAHGLYQVASEVISKYDLLLLARDAFGVDVEIKPDDTVVSRRNLNGEHFSRETGITVPSWPQMMADLAADPTPYANWR